MAKNTILLVLILACLASLPALAQDEKPASIIPWKTEEYTLVAREMSLREALTTFGTAQGIPVALSEYVSGVVSGDFRKLPPLEFLNRITILHNLTWFYDGAALYIYSSSENQTVLLDLKYMKVGDVRSMLVELGVDDGRFPLKTTSDEQLVMVSGPPRYVILVAELIAKADKLREKRAYGEVETRIFPLSHTWADDVNLNVSGAESGGQIKGVAKILEEIMIEKTNVPVKEKKEDGTTENATAKEEEKIEDPSSEVELNYTPVIKAENRLNAVIVKDLSSRMPLYEAMIAKLDVPQKLVEIAVTSLELSKDDALDWQLSLAVRGQAGHLDGAAGQNFQNLFSAEELLGNGLAGAMSYIGKHVTVSASLSALRQKGKARSISRTSLLTMNNMGATISDMQSYHARVVGAEVASLEEVSAGTNLSVKPRIVMSKDPKKPNQCWMTITLSDGGFETVSVDSMPLTRQSTLTTQAAVNEGDCILLAGYMRDIEEKAGWGIPLLRDIPYIGWLFGGISKKKQTLQRMFILTPYIVELDTADLARIQATRQRDIHREEKLDEDKQEDDAVRELRDLEREERERIRREQTQDQLEKRKAELKLEREKRKADRKDKREEWQEDLQEKREEWEQERTPRGEPEETEQAMTERKTAALTARHTRSRQFDGRR